MYTCNEIDRAVITKADANFDCVSWIYSLCCLLFLMAVCANVSHDEKVYIKIFNKFILKTI